MYCPCSTAAIVRDTGQWYRCTVDITAPFSHAVLQEDGGQWVVGRILEGAALEDKRVYQQMYREMIQYNGQFKLFIYMCYVKQFLYFFRCQGVTWSNSHHEYHQHWYPGLSRHRKNIDSRPRHGQRASPSKEQYRLY